MDLIDKLLSKLQREKAPASLRARILDIPERAAAPRFGMRFFRVAVPALVLLVLVSSVVYFQYYKVRNIAAAFELSVQDSDAAGISPDSVFVLKSSKDITAAQVKKVVKISPDVDFDVESSGQNRFLIKPLQKLSGNTVYQLSIAEGVAERDFSWAFQVRAPFAALSTFPRNQVTSVPVNSTIEVVFNRENIEQPEKYFQISPDVKGRLEVHNDKAVFVPAKPLQERTVYTVTFKQGLTAKGADDKLSSDVVFTFETGQSSYQPYQDFGFNQDFVHLPTDRMPAMEINQYNVDLSSASAAIYSFASKDDFIRGYYASRNWDLGWTQYYRQGSSAYDTSKLTKLSSFNPQIVKLEYQTFLEIPDKLPAGYYLLDVKAGDLRRQAWILVNDISHYYSLTDSNGFAWVYQYSQKSPLDGATVAYYDASGNRHELGKTNSQGLAQFNVPDALKSAQYGSADYGKPKVIEIEKPGQPATFALVSAGWWFYGGSSTADDYWKYLSTDRFTYRLSDTIRFWGVVKGKSQDYRQQNVKVQLVGGGYYYDYYQGMGPSSDTKPIAETEAAISPFDTISGSLSFNGVNPGTYTLSVLLNDQIVESASVEILAYTKPLYQITVTPNKQSVFAGDPVDFNVKASFYDGTPVGNLQLNYSGYDTSRSISGQLTLNDKGEGKVTLTPQYSKSAYYPTTMSLNFVPALAEEADITSESTSYVLVFGSHVYLQASQKYNNNDNFTITAKANNIVIGQLLDNRDSSSPYPEYIGQPAGGVALKAEITKTEYVQIEEGTVYDPINRISVPQYRYEERKSTVSTVSGQTGSNGEWVFNVNLPKADRTYYQVNITGTDNTGRALSATVWPYYYQEYNRYYYQGSTSTQNNVVLSLSFDGGEKDYQKRFSVGDTVQLSADAIVGQQFLSGQMLFYRYGHSGIGRLELVNTNKFSEQFSADFKPAASYLAVVFGPYGFVESNSLMAAYDASNAKLNINIKPDKDGYKPGDTAKIDVEVKDKNGKTQDGEVNLSVVDEAVFDVVPYYWQQDILSSLYAVDYTDPRSGASDFTPQGLEQRGGAEGGGCFLPGTQILLPGGKTRSIENIKVGDVVATRGSESDASKEVPAIVQGISSHLVDSYLVINGSLKVTTEHRLYSNGAWVPAGLLKIGDKLEDESGQKVIIASIQKVIAPKTMVYNINVGKFHTYYAGGYFVHNAEKGGGYRSEFLDTAHYESAQLKDGKATFSFKLPDNITSWRATVNAFEPGNILAGQDSKLLPTSLPFFVDSVISETYLTGDKPTIGIRGFGTQFNPAQDMAVNVDIDALNYHTTTTIKSGSGNLALPELKPGNYELKIKAKQGSLEDGIIRKFGVVDSYFTSKQSKTTGITNGLTGLPGNANGYTDVAFTDQGKTRFYNELLWNQYNGGKRADQVAAVYLAKQMLKDYFGSQGDVPQLDLSNYHVPNGGIALFTYGDTDLRTSAELADLVPNSVYQPQLVSYFQTTMRNDKADIHRIALSLYGLASLKQPVLAKLQLVKDEPDLTLEDRMYVALGLARLGDKEGARSYYEKNVRTQLRFEGGQAWLDNEQDQTKRVKLTTLAGAVAAAAGHHDDALAVWAYGQEHYPTEDLDILERFMIVRSEINQVSQDTASFTYEVNGRREDVKLDKGYAKTISFSRDELQNIKFSNVKGQPVAISVLETSQDPGQLQKNNELSVTRKYLVNGKETTSFKEGDTVVVHLEYQISRSAMDGGYQVVDFLPSGFKAVTNLWDRGLSSAYAQCYQKGYPLSVEGNKVYFSAYHSRDNKSECGTYTVEYYARVAAKGSFTAAPPLIQSLKNYSSLNIGPSQSITIDAGKR